MATNATCVTTRGGGTTRITKRHCWKSCQKSVRSEARKTALYRDQRMVAAAGSWQKHQEAEALMRSTVKHVLGSGDLLLAFRVWSPHRKHLRLQQRPRKQLVHSFRTCLYAASGVRPSHGTRLSENTVTQPNL